MLVGLRIDVDTLRGTRRGVPALVESLARVGAAGTFFLSVGPDNMGRHLWRLARPRFLAKMVRTRAPSLYGWDILLRGTVLPGPIIGQRAAGAIRALAAASGHEIGLHAWDHHAWQVGLERMSAAEVDQQLARASALITELTGRRPTCSAAPAWRVTPLALERKEGFPFRYNSDCRGRSPFRPRLEDGSAGRLQLPATLPTFDERVGPEVGPDRFFAELLEELTSQELAVVTIHAEVEGLVGRPPFERFLERATAAGCRFVALGELAERAVDAPIEQMVRREISGREGWVSCQAGVEEIVSSLGVYA